MSTQNFIKIDSVIFFNRTIPATCRDIHSLVIDLLKIPGWIIRKKHIADQLKISLRTVNRYFNLLVKMGLAFYDALKHRWHVFKSPNINNNAPSSDRGLPLLVGGALPELVAINQKENYPEEKTTTHVVVIEEEKLVFPDKLIKEQKKACKAIIKKAPIHLQQDVLFELAYRMTLQNMRSVPAFLNTLVTAANNGTFTRTQAAGDTKIVNKGIEQAEKIKADRTKENKSDKEKGKFEFSKIRLEAFGRLRG
jgi:hypothetical protein